MDRLSRALNPPVNQSCPPPNRNAIACYIFCSRFPFSHAALSCFKIAHPTEPSAEVPLAQMASTKQLCSQRRCKENAAAPALSLPCMQGGPDGRKGCHWYILGSSSIYLLPFHPGHSLLPQHYFSIPDLSNVTFFVGF